jgi:XapX domain-containing protein
MKFAIALLVAFSIGFVCRYFELPVPAPPALPGALIVVAITLGFLAADAVFKKPTEPEQTIASKVGH